MEDIDRLVTVPIRELSLHRGVKNSSWSHLASYPVSDRVFLRSQRESDPQISPIQITLLQALKAYRGAVLQLHTLAATAVNG